MVFSRREVIERNGLFFEEGIIHEDNLFQWELVSVCERAAVLNEPLYCRRIRQGSITQVDNYFQKCYSMYVSAKRADEFLKIHPEVNGTAASWQIMWFARMVMCYWVSMDDGLKWDAEIVGFIRETRPLVNKYQYINDPELSLFLTNVRLFYLHEEIYKRRKKITKAGRRMLRVLLRKSNE